MKEAYELAEKCRADSSQAQLTIDDKNVRDEYEKKLKSLFRSLCKRLVVLFKRVTSMSQRATLQRRASQKCFDVLPIP